MTRVSPIKSFGLREVEAIAGRQIGTANANAKSALAGLSSYGYEKLGLRFPHRLAHFISQIMHESANFRYDQELWGPTPAQKRYDTRTNLGNTPEADGDGFHYRGRAGIQITGKANYGYYTAWAKKNFAHAPDFVKDPDALLTDPWEGLAAVWFWERNNVNAAADTGGVSQVTKIINGGQNGLADRRALYVKTALVLLGYGPGDVLRFQMDNDLDADGVAGPKTFAVLHRSLLLAPALGDTGTTTTTVTSVIPSARPAIKRSSVDYGIVGVMVAALAAIYSYLTGG
jgi:putative chitinase